MKRFLNTPPQADRINTVALSVRLRKLLSDNKILHKDFDKLILGIDTIKQNKRFYYPTTWSKLGPDVKQMFIKLDKFLSDQQKVDDFIRSVPKKNNCLNREFFINFYSYLNENNLSGDKLSLHVLGKPFALRHYIKMAIYDVNKLNFIQRGYFYRFSMWLADERKKDEYAQQDKNKIIETVKVEPLDA
jgi:hypothetical protein